MSALSRIAREWAERCFGIDHVNNFAIRSLRTLEEAAEMSQAFGVSRELALKAINTVYDRPVGDPEQEMGGVLHTMNILCDAMGVEPDEIAERELRRCLKKSPEHFAKRNQEKLDLGLDAGAQSSGDTSPKYCYTDDKWCRSLNGAVRCSDCPVGNGQPTIVERLTLDKHMGRLPTDMPGDDKARKAYEHSCDNGPIHSNRMPMWAELGDTEKNAWRAAVGSQDGPIPAITVGPQR
jgi:hypothetical protein